MTAATRFSSGLSWLASVVLFAILLVCSLPSPAAAQQTPPDNTKKNQNAGITADQQKNNSSDLQITRRIRRLVMNDKALSTYAHNIKVITRDGHVTLKGPVNSQKEKEAIAAKASEVAGQGNVTDEIRIVPKHSTQ
ncbi:MAG TPA: BON domain-containing protein [Candidatus Acidoferrales bacterium]|nr:BON domain-containing protein [Candidatus Acidoferrales bacterium]